MSRKEEYEALLNEQQERINSEDISARRIENHQGNKKDKAKGKAAVAIVAAGAVAAGGIAGGVALAKDGFFDKLGSFFAGDKETSKKNSEFNYALVENFNVNKEKQVDAVVEDIKANTESKSNVKNIIYFYNDTIARENFSSELSDVEVFKELQSYLTQSYDLFNNEAANEYANARSHLQSGNADTTFPTKKVLTPSAILTKSKTTSKYNKKINNNLENILTAIRNGENDKIGALSTEFYEIYLEVKEDDRLSDGQRKIYLDYFDAICSIYDLSKTQTDDINGEHQAFDGSDLLIDTLDKFGIDAAKVIKEAEEDGTFGKELTELKEAYNAKDANKANNSSYVKDSGSDKNKKTEKRGDKSKGSKGKQEVITPSKEVNKEEEKQEIVNVPDDSKPKDKVENEGGKPVGDPVIEEKPGEVLSEEDFAPDTSSDSVTQEIISSEEVFYADDGEEFAGILTQEELDEINNSANAYVKSIL